MSNIQKLEIAGTIKYDVEDNRRVVVEVRYESEYTDATGSKISSAKSRYFTVWLKEPASFRAGEPGHFVGEYGSKAKLDENKNPTKFVDHVLQKATPLPTQTFTNLLVDEAPF